MTRSNLPGSVLLSGSTFKNVPFREVTLFLATQVMKRPGSFPGLSVFVSSDQYVPNLKFSLARATKNS